MVLYIKTKLTYFIKILCLLSNYIYDQTLRAPISKEIIEAEET